MIRDAVDNQVGLLFVCNNFEKSKEGGGSPTFY